MAHKRDAIGLDAFSEIVALIYAAASDSARWPDLLARLARVFEASAALAIIKPDSPGSAGLAFYGRTEFREVRDLLQHVPLGPALRLLPDQTVATVAEIMPGQDWRETPFYREACASFGITDILLVDVKLADSSALRLRFIRTEGGTFDTADRQAAALFVPHLRSALELRQRLVRETVVRRRHGEACDRLGVAIFILDEKGRVLEANRSAYALVQGQRGLALSNDRLVAASEREARLLRVALRNAAASGTPEEPFRVLSLHAQDGERLHLLIRRVDDADLLIAGRHAPAVVVYARDPAFQVLATDATRRLFNLTHTETELLVRLANGLSVVEAAEDMRIRPTTARTHLRAIFAKTGVSRQSSLVRQVLNSIGTMVAELPPAVH